MCFDIYIYISFHNYPTSQIYSANAINVPLKVEELDTEEEGFSPVTQLVSAESLGLDL